VSRHKGKHRTKRYKTCLLAGVVWLCCSSTCTFKFLIKETIMKKLMTALLFALGLVSVSAMACPAGETLTGGTGAHHKGGTCVPKSGVAMPKATKAAKPAVNTSAPVATIGAAPASVDSAAAKKATKEEQKAKKAADKAAKKAAKDAKKAAAATAPAAPAK
jgi:hypothetical protein